MILKIFQKIKKPSLYIKAYKIKYISFFLSFIYFFFIDQQKLTKNVVGTSKVTSTNR